MDKQEVLGLIIAAIEKARKETSYGLLELVPSPENGLASFSKALIFSELSKLGSSEKVLELILPRRVKKHSVVDGRPLIELEAGNYDFDVEAGKVFWRVVHTDGSVPVVNRTLVSNESLKICVKLKENFDNWLAAYRLRRQDDLNTLTLLNLAKLYGTTMDLDEKLQVDPAPHINISVYFKNSPVWLGAHFDPVEYREHALTYMKNKGIIRSFFINHSRFINGSHQSRNIDVFLNVSTFLKFKEKLIQVYQAKQEELEPRPAPSQPNQISQSETDRDSAILYEVKLTSSREVLLNGLQLSRMDFAGENEIVFNHLFKNPNRAIPVEELEKLVGGTGLKKSLHKIVENTGFQGDLKKAFFDISKTVIRFRNPLRRKDLEELGITYLKLPRQPSLSPVSSES